MSRRRLCVQIILSSKPDTRMTFVIGISMAFGLSLDVAPELYAQVPFWVRPLFDPSLTLATVLAVLLHQVFRIGAPAAAKVATEKPAEG
jgi:xanthine permease XanP